MLLLMFENSKNGIIFRISVFLGDFSNDMSVTCSFIECKSTIGELMEKAD